MSLKYPTLIDQNGITYKMLLRVLVLILVNILLFAVMRDYFWHQHFIEKGQRRVAIVAHFVGDAFRIP